MCLLSSWWRGGSESKTFNAWKLQFSYVLHGLLILIRCSDEIPIEIASTGVATELKIGAIFVLMMHVVFHVKDDMFLIFVTIWPNPWKSYQGTSIVAKSLSINVQT